MFVSCLARPRFDTLEGFTEGGVRVHLTAGRYSGAIPPQHMSF